MLLCQWLRQQNIALQSIMEKSSPGAEASEDDQPAQEVEFDRLGLVLQNRYSFDGQTVINPWHLRGRDRLAYEAFELLGAGLPEISSCKIVHETVLPRKLSPQDLLEE